MKVQSLIKDKNTLVPVEVELTLWPGLPGIQFLGLPDQHLKESALRIKSAIKHAGFQFPIAQQILVNLRPSHLKKTSRGLELAVAAAYLWETGQLAQPVLGSDYFIYGELTLSGDVIEPEDLGESFQSNHPIVLTGETAGEKAAPFRRQVIRNLQALVNPEERASQETMDVCERPWELVKQKFSVSQAQLLEILATGEHSVLLAGPAGSGKTTVAKALPGFIKQPFNAQFKALKRIHSEFGEKLIWRPIVKPHHSTPTMAMIGGGSVPFAGEISRAHGGVLILDELLEFAPQVQEALREPFEEGKMRVFRNGRLAEYPAQAQMIATTNLCPCGDWTPLRSKQKPCRFALNRCRSYSHRLSGPLIDRFEMLEFTDRIGELTVNGEKILERVQAAQAFSEELFGTWKPNSRRPFNEVLSTIRPTMIKLAGMDQQSSQRRKVAILRVARTLADLELSRSVERQHIDRAVTHCRDHFERLKRWE